MARSTRVEMVRTCLPNLAERVARSGRSRPDWISHPLDDAGTMEEIRRYREAFAAFLATGSRLRRLEGAEKYKAERRLMEADDEVDVDVEVKEVNESD